MIGMRLLEHKHMLVTNPSNSGLDQILLKSKLIKILLSENPEITLRSYVKELKNMSLSVYLFYFEKGRDRRKELS